MNDKGAWAILIGLVLGCLCFGGCCWGGGGWGTSPYAGGYGPAMGPTTAPPPQTLSPAVDAGWRASPTGPSAATGVPGTAVTP